MNSQKSDPIADRSPEQQQKNRERLQQDIEAYLAKGGKIESCDSQTKSKSHYTKSQRDSHRARDRMRLTRINSRMIKEYQETFKEEPGYLLSLEEFSVLIGVSEDSIKQWHNQHALDKDELPRPAVEEPFLWELQDVMTWYDALKEKSRNPE